MTLRSKIFSSNLIQKQKNKNWEKTAKIGQACVEFYKTKILHVIKMDSMHEISVKLQHALIFERTSDFRSKIEEMNVKSQK